MFKHWSRLPGEVDALSLLVFKKRLDDALNVLQLLVIPEVFRELDQMIVGHFQVNYSVLFMTEDT